ncbi:hypothetical protein RND81_01G093500 [Saponaria officinalis]|uniref:Retrotransposon gag domain-containing protein n=1 Tax=Saponaria officinalis TaxID=3572 RepID=A0AAW1N9A5_SAPOF
MGACREMITGVLDRLAVPEEEKPNKRIYQMIDMINNLRSIIEELKIEVTELQVRRIRDSSGLESPKIKVPEQPKYSGERDSKEIDNFLWSIERYFSNVRVLDDDTKIRIATLYLIDDVIPWWRRREIDIQRGTCTITTWEEFKTDFKNQFYPKNATEVGMKKLRNLKQTGTIRDYIIDIPESMSLLYFMDGLKRGVEQELKRRNVKTLSDTIAYVESLYEGPSEMTDKITRNDREKGRSRGRDSSQAPKPSMWKTSESKGQYKDKPKEKSYSRGDAKCFLCDGSHFIRDCPTKQRLNAMTKAYFIKAVAPVTFEGDGSITIDNRVQVPLVPRKALSKVRTVSTQRTTKSKEKSKQNDKDVPKRESSIEVSDVLPFNSLWTTQGRVNCVKAAISMDPRALHNVLSIKRANRSNIEYSYVKTSIKPEDHEENLECRMAYNVQIQLSEWQGVTDFMIAAIKDDEVLLGAKYLTSIVSWKWTPDTQIRRIRVRSDGFGPDLGSVAIPKEDRPLEIILEPTRTKKKKPSKRDKEPKRKKGLDDDSDIM